MTDDDLATLLRRDLSHHEPPWLPDVSVPVISGRRRLRYRRALSAGAAAGALVVAGLVAAPMLGDDDGSSRVLDPAQQSLADYDPQVMPQTLEDHSRTVLERSVPALGPVTFRAGDGQGDALPPDLYDKASGMSVDYGTAEHKLSVDLSHARSEAEGSAEKFCSNGLAEGYYLECTVDTDASGNVVISQLQAVRPFHQDVDSEGLMAVTVDELDTTNPARLYFLRSVKVIKSETLVTHAQEQVRASSRDAAEALFQVPVADLVEIGTDPALVIPEPPTDDSGCGPWTQDSAVSYSC